MKKKYGGRLKSICKDNKIDFSSLSLELRTILFSRVVHSWKLEPSSIKLIKEEKWE
jgi:hypothetical protein